MYIDVYLKSVPLFWTTLYRPCSGVGAADSGGGTTNDDASTDGKCKVDSGVVRVTGTGLTGGGRGSNAV